MPMTHDEYCANVCGAKCCYNCPNLNPDKTCAILEQWTEGVCNHQWEDTAQVTGYDLEDQPMYLVYHGRGIQHALNNNLLPQAIKDQCCYAHPELLEE